MVAVRQFPQINIEQCRARLIWAYARVIDPKFVHAPLGGSGHTICWLIESGSVRIQIGHDVGEVKAGHWVFLEQGSGRQDFEPGTQLISIRFTLRLPGGAPLFPRKKRVVFSAEEYPELQGSARYLVEKARPWLTEGGLGMCRNQMPVHRNFEVEAAFYRWLAMYSNCMVLAGAEAQGPLRLDDRLEQALNLIHTHPLHTRFTVIGLARACGVNVHQLVRLFTRELNETPLHIYDHRRHDAAIHWLVDSTLQIKEIAFNLGFSSAAHFSSWFKRREEISPRGFRSQAGDVRVTSKSPFERDSE